MGKRIAWFDMLSPKQREAREREVRNAIFPFGEAQRAAEIDLLRKLIHTRSTESVLLFQLAQAKEAVNADDKEALKEWFTSPLARSFKREERACILAAAQLERTITSLDEMPDKESVEQLAMNLLRSNQVW